MADGDSYRAMLQWPGAPKSWPYSMLHDESFIYEKLGYDIQKTGGKIDFEKEAPFLRTVLGGAPPEVQLHNLKQWFGYVEPIYKLEAVGKAPSPASMEFAGLEPIARPQIVNFVYRDRDGTYRLYNAQGGGIQNLKGEMASTARFQAETIPQVATGLLSIGPGSLPTHVPRVLGGVAARGALAGGSATAGRTAFDTAMGVAAGYEDPRPAEEKRAEMLGLGIFSGLGEVGGASTSLIGRGVTKQWLRGRPTLTAAEEAAYRLKPSRQQVISDRIQLAERIVGRPPSLGQVTGRGVIRSLEGLLSKYPWGSDVMKKFSLDFLDSWGAKAQNFLESALPQGGRTTIPTGQESGGIFRQSLFGPSTARRMSWIDRIKDDAAIRYGYLDAQVPESRLITEEDIAPLRELAEQWRSSPNLDTISGRSAALRRVDNIIAAFDAGNRPTQAGGYPLQEGFVAGAVRGGGGGGTPAPPATKEAYNFATLRPEDVAVEQRIGGYSVGGLNPSIPTVLRGADGGWRPGRPLTLADVIESRSAFGEKMRGIHQMDEISDMDKDALYATLSRVRDNVYNSVDPSGKLVRLRNFADKDYEQAMLEWEHLLEKVTGAKKPGFVGEYRAMTALESLASNASDEFNLALSKLQPNERGLITVALTNRMGRAGEGAAFDPWRLAGAIERLPKESREAIAPAGSAMDEWLTLNRRMMDLIGSRGTVSQNPLFVQQTVTAPAMMVSDAAYNREWGKIAQGVGAALGMIKIPQGAARLLTNKTFVRWVGELTEATPRGGIETLIDQIITHPARLAAVTQGMSDYDELISLGQFIEGLMTFSQQERTVPQSSLLNQANRGQAAVNPSALTSWQGR